MITMFCNLSYVSILVNGLLLRAPASAFMLEESPWSGPSGSYKFKARAFGDDAVLQTLEAFLKCEDLEYTLADFQTGAAIPTDDVVTHVCQRVLLTLSDGTSFILDTEDRGRPIHVLQCADYRAAFPTIPIWAERYAQRPYLVVPAQKRNPNFVRS